MKKQKYPNLDDYDLSDYVELKGNILYKINGGAMSDADQAAMAEACKSGNAEKQAEIRAKYETKDSASTATSAGTKTIATAPASTATSTVATTQTETVTQPTVSSEQRQYDMAKQDAEKKTGTSSSSTSSYSSGGYSGQGGSASSSGSSSKSSSGSKIYVSALTQEYTMGEKDGKMSESARSSTSNSDLKGNGFQKTIVKETKNYSVDYKNAVVKVDIKDREHYEDALNACILNGVDCDIEFKLQLTDGKNVVHTFSSIVPAAKFVYEKGVDSNLIENEKNVEAYVKKIEQNPENYRMEAYNRKAMGAYLGKKDVVRMHSLYVITDETTGKKSTLSFNGTKLAVCSEGAWGLNTDMDVDSWNSYVNGDNDYDMVPYKITNGIDVQQTASNIIGSINSDISYMAFDHVWDWSNYENCNTALFNTLSVRKGEQ